MAEGLLRHDAGDRFEVFSAGTKPNGTWLRPRALYREAVPGVMPSRPWAICDRAEFPVHRISTRFLAAIVQLPALCEALRHPTPVSATTAPAIGKGTSRRRRRRAEPP